MYPSLLIGRDTPDTDFVGRMPDFRPDFPLNIQISSKIGNKQRQRYLIFYTKQLRFQEDIFENVMNWCGYLFNLAGYPAIFSIRYPAGYPVHSYGIRIRNCILMALFKLVFVLLRLGEEEGKGTIRSHRCQVSRIIYNI
jgi:hypothetical protein